LQRFEDIPKNNGQSSLYEVANQIGISQNRSQFIPGRFYSLRITSQVPNLTEAIVPMLNDGKPYIDLNPLGLVLFHENWKETALVLNLRVIPPTVCSKLLEGYYYFSMQNGLERLFKDGKLIPLTERSLIDQRFYLVTTSILSQILGISNLNFAINKYNIDRVAEAKLIDWDNFGMLIRPRVDQRGIFPENLTLASVFEDFMTNSLT
jgi:hypothetical protein